MVVDPAPGATSGPGLFAKIERDGIARVDDYAAGLIEFVIACRNIPLAIFNER